jgi:hypothetical protein
MDFTLKKYETFLEAVRENNIPCYTVREWLEKRPGQGIFIRHDVDRSPGNALKMAELENRYRVKATYYFRAAAHCFKPGIIKKIHRWNHEVGYHYEDLSRSRGDYKKAIACFERNLHRFRQVAPIETIAMHGSPLSPIDNRDLWKTYDIHTYQLKGEAFLSIDYSNIYYFTDTGRSWKEKSVNLRDKVSSLRAEIPDTGQLIEFIKQRGRSESIGLVFHPERWASGSFNFLAGWTRDILVNMIKRTIKGLRN